MQGADAQPAGSQPGLTAPAPNGPGSQLMATPQPNLGEQAKAKASIQMAVKVLYMSGIAFDPMTDEAKAIRKAIESLSKAFGASQHDANELVPNEIATLMSGMAGPQGGGGGSPGIPGGTQGAAAPTAGGVG